MLARAEWGAKHVCPECASRYYDLKQTTYVCPSCGAQPPVARLPIGGRGVRGMGRTPFGRRRPAAPAPAPVEREEERAATDRDEDGDKDDRDNEDRDDDDRDDEDRDEAEEREAETA